MNTLTRALAASAAGALLATAAGALDATSLVVPAENEAPPKIQIDPPLPGPLANGVAFIPYRLENFRILPIGGPGSKQVSPRVGHLHITLDDAPWQWADYGQSNTIILVNLPRGEHKVLVEVVDTEGHLLTSQNIKFVSLKQDSP